MQFTLNEVDFKTGEVLETTQVEMDYSKEELEAFYDLFCECDYLDNNPKVQPKFVTNYKGVSHGWICPKCRKFVQIG